MARRLIYAPSWCALRPGWAEYEAFASRDLSQFEVIYLFVDGIAERLHLGQPREAGRARAARNHFRHGLSLPVHSDPTWSEEVQALARETAGTNANADIQDLARQVAEAHIEMPKANQRISPNSRPLPTAIDVVQPHDIVFAEVASHLHLDQFERNLAGIGKPMNAPNGDIARLVFVHGAHVIANRDLSSPLHDHPMFRAVKVFLQRKRAAGLHDNSLHTVTGGNVHVLVIAPGSVNAAVLNRGAIIAQLEFFDQNLDLLGLGARRDQHGVGGRHHDDVVEPDHGGEH